jgi:hypothetical protein
VSKGGDAWGEAGRAWKRLARWHARDDGLRDEADAAIDALDDLGHVRRMLDRLELAAVRTARRHGKSWSEIATALGVTRQSAWERWRDLDADPQTSVRRQSASAVVEGVFTSVSQEVVADLTSTARPRGTIRVPQVVGLGWTEARDVLIDCGLIGIAAEDGADVATGVVSDQSPEAGAKVARGSVVRLWVRSAGDGGSGGVREPRRPSPAPKSGRAYVEDAIEDTAS